VIGTNVNVKNTFLNGLFGDIYLPESYNTAQRNDLVDHFRVGSGGGNKIISPSFVRSMIVDRQNNTLVDTNLWQETVHDINSCNDLSKEIRDDASFVFVNIPCIEKSRTSLDGENYLLEKWVTFDRAIVVLDPMKENEAACLHVLHVIEQLIKRKKKVPVVLLYNRPANIRTDEAVTRTVHKIEQEVRLFNETNAKQAGKYKPTIGSKSSIPIKIDILSYDSDEDDEEQTPEPSPLLDDSVDEFHSASVAIDIYSTSIKTATIFQLAAKSKLTLRYVELLDNETLDEIGMNILTENQWHILPDVTTKQAVILERLTDSKTAEEYFIDSDFDSIIHMIQNLVGNHDEQTRLLKEQEVDALKHLEAVTPFAKQLVFICDQYKCLEDDPTDLVSTCIDRFWDLYRVCEDSAFAKFERELNPERLALPMDQLSEYKLWVEKTALYDEKDRIETALRLLVKRQLQMVLHENSVWSFDEWYSKMNANEWKKVANQEWDHVSPSDWSTIISSILLASSDCYFYENFGPEKIALERARFLSNDKLVTTDIHSKHFKKFSAADGCPSLEHSLDGGYDKGRFRPKYPQTFDCVVQFNVPDKISNKAHWGYLPWRCCNIVRA
jgi:hypothetical protein